MSNEIQKIQRVEKIPGAKKMNRVRNIALASILAAGIVGAPYLTAQTANADAGSTTTTVQSNTASTSSSTDSMTKEETVYVFNKADGSVKNTIVSDWLKNGDGAATLNDVSTLTNIKNTEGDQAFAQNGSDVTWAANGSDIYYQGNTTQEPPVTMKITYSLDGVEMTPDQIAGKSGKVTIRFDYTNNSTSVQNGMTTYTPFVVVTGLQLANDNFCNVEVTNGKLLNDGEHTSIAGYALPGMQDNLGVSKDTLDVPDYFEITADATDFKMDTTATVITNDLLSNTDTSKIDTSTVADSLNQLQSAMTQLLDGSSTLTDGLSQLAAGSATLGEGLDSATDGTKKLESASTQVNDGLDQLKNGTDTQTGLVDAVDSLGDDDDTTNTTLLGGTNLINAGLASLQTQLDTSLDTATTAIDNQLIGSASKGTGLDYAVASIGDASTNGTLLYGANMASTYIGNAFTATQAAGSDLTDVGTDLTDAGTQMYALSQNQAFMQSLASNPTAAQAFQSLKTDVTNAGGSATSAGTNTKNAGTAEYVAKTVLDGGTIPGVGTVTGVIPGLTSLKTGLSQAEAGLTQLSTSLKSGKTAVDNGIGQLETGVTTLKKSLILMRDGGQISATKSSKGLQGAVDALGGANTDGTLIYGETAIGNGLSSLFSGLTKASDGSDTLTENLNTAEQGSATLSDGLRQFDEEGVQKLLDAYNDNLAGLSDRVQATVDAAKAYNNFTGKSSEISGSVKFIYETDAINED